MKCQMGVHVVARGQIIQTIRPLEKTKKGRLPNVCCKTSKTNEKKKKNLVFLSDQPLPPTFIVK